MADGETAATAYTIGWEPQPGPQTALLACPVFEVFFGGARGGGKTDGMLGEWASHADLHGKNAVGLMVHFRATGNHGGPGPQWVKARYIDPNPAGWEVRKFTYENPWTRETIEQDRVFIPSKLRDNKFLGPEYVANLQMVGSDTLVRAWLEGDWTVVEGAYFDCW